MCPSGLTSVKILSLAARLSCIMKIGVEVENGTGNSYVYNSINGELIPAEFKIDESNATKVNWIIRAGGE